MDKLKGESEPMNHSEAPWTVMKHYSSEVYDGLIIVDAQGENVANMWHNNHVSDDAYITQREANAEFIVTACNSFDDMLAALKDLVSIAEATHGAHERVNRAKSIIAKAEGRE